MVKLRYDSPHQGPGPPHIGRGAAGDARVQPRAVALFDLDGTLTTRDTFLPFLLFYARRQRRWWPLSITPFVVAAYLFRMISDRTAKQILITAFVGGDPVSTVDDAAIEFSQSWVPRYLHHVGVGKLREHQVAGDRVILVSASPDIYVPAIARQLGIEEVLCTRVQRHASRVLGSIVGANCKRQAKVQFLAAHLNNDRAPANSYAYGDSHHDLPMLQWVTYGYLIRSQRLQRVDNARHA